MQAHSEFKGGPKQQTVSHVMVSIPSVMRRAYSPKDIIFPAKPLLPHPIYTHWAKLHSYQYSQEKSNTLLGEWACYQSRLTHRYVSLTWSTSRIPSHFGHLRSICHKQPKQHTQTRHRVSVCSRLLQTNNSNKVCVVKKKDEKHTAVTEACTPIREYSAAC